LRDARSNATYRKEQTGNRPSEIFIAFISGIVSLVKRDESVRKLTSIAYIIAGVAAVYVGIVLSRSAYNM
jgi:hypothetical protein